MHAADEVTLSQISDQGTKVYVTCVQAFKFHDAFQENMFESKGDLPSPRSLTRQNQKGKKRKEWETEPRKIGK